LNTRRRCLKRDEAINRQRRKAIKTKGHFPNEEAARKLSTAFIPYALRFAAIEWWWAPDAHFGSTAVSVCLRCGDIRVPRRQPRSDLPLCTSCRRHGENELQTWPTHAIAPAERGTWWLGCLTAGCNNLFLGHAQARRCTQCRSALITPTRRRPASA
jgi:hypothetical protein